MQQHLVILIFQCHLNNNTITVGKMHDRAGQGHQHITITLPL